jgi:TolA-binding protein
VKPVAAGKPDPKRKALVDAVEIPVSTDATEDAYAYGFRLWQAKLYPEAQTKLKEFVAKYPTHKRASYAQNLLGRAYLDEGKPALASVAFYDNYQKMPRGERASESLYWLGVALTKLNKPADACKVYKEFDDVYGAKAPGDLKSKVSKGRTDAKCTA